MDGVHDLGGKSGFGAVDQSGTAQMMVDRELVVVSANPATMALLTKHQEALASVFPGFKPENLIGTCIDDFHANPAHQRQILSNPANLPYQADISIGDLKFALNVTAIMDASDEYVGTALEWEDVTELRQQQDLAVRLQGAVDQSGTASMMVDRELVVVSANPATMALLSTGSPYREKSGVWTPNEPVRVFFASRARRSAIAPMSATSS